MDEKISLSFEVGFMRKVLLKHTNMHTQFWLLLLVEYYNFILQSLLQDLRAVFVCCVDLVVYYL
jgi:hypothetical protein